ncbi:MAG: hypothetical protein F7C32_02810 [Desulfurococcales archaeon]|nr:hypothetical protein [Desulfurococcales archaeon]
MNPVYEQFWKAVRGEELDTFIAFIQELGGDGDLDQRFLSHGYPAPVNLSQIPLPTRFLAFLEELVSALLIEIGHAERYVPQSCRGLLAYLDERRELAFMLYRDLIQEEKEYSIPPEKTAKAKALLEAYKTVIDTLLQICRTRPETTSNA